jgi:hypothetical protein
VEFENTSSVIISQHSPHLTKFSLFSVIIKREIKRNYHTTQWWIQSNPPNLCANYKITPNGSGFTLTPPPANPSQQANKAAVPSKEKK